jgi:hypothetical protein
MTSTKRKLKVAFPFSNGDYYIEIREGSKFRDWLKNKQVPEDLKHWTIREGHREESVRCPTKNHAAALIRELDLRVTSERKA